MTPAEADAKAKELSERAMLLPPEKGDALIREETKDFPDGIRRLIMTQSSHLAETNRLNKTNSMVKLVKANQPLMLTIVIGGFLIAAFFAIVGVILVWQGATGDTSFTFFGQTFSSKNAGIASVFLAAVTVVLIVRRVLKSADHTNEQESDR